MLTWMLYVMVVSLLLGLAALAAEHRSRLKRSAGRWFWLLAILASLLIPTVIASVSVQLPNILSPEVSNQVVALREVTNQQLSPAYWIGQSALNSPQVRNFDPLLQRAWSLISLLMLLALLSSAAHLYWHKRRWPSGSIVGVNVYLSPDVGPAVVGLFRPVIVTPSWLTQSPTTVQQAVIAHEQSHLDAGDQRLLTIALGLLVFMPWNLPLWWQLHRLRNAIEVDCDARVLKSGISVANYGQTLLAIGERQSRYIGAVAAMTESPSFLETRLKIMTQKRSKTWRLTAAAMGLLATALTAVAAQVSPPNGTNSLAAISKYKEIQLSEAALDGYVGTYRLGEDSVLTIARRGAQVKAQITGQPAIDIFPESSKLFFFKVVDAQLHFVLDGKGKATGFELHQNGVQLEAVRIESAEAEQINQVLADKIKGQTATAGSEAALRRMVESQAAGKPNYAEMSPELAAETKKQMPQIKSLFDNIGPLQSIKFRGVGNQGWDVYELKFERAVLVGRIHLTPSGIINGALLIMEP